MTKYEFIVNGQRRWCQGSSQKTAVVRAVINEIRRQYRSYNKLRATRRFEIEVTTVKRGAG